MDVNDVVAEKVAGARRKIAADKQRRAELAEARRHGLAARQRQKLAYLRGQTNNTERTDQSGQDTRARDQNTALTRGTGPTPAARTRTRETAQEGDGS